MAAANHLKDMAVPGRPPVEAVHAGERLGQASSSRPEGRLLWVHAHTFDEAAPAAALAQGLSNILSEPVSALVTTSQPSARSTPRADAVIHQLAPSETAGSVTRFLDHWRPDACIVFGLHDRLKLFAAAKKKRLPLYLVAADRGLISAERRIPMVTSDVLKTFDICFAASAADAAALRKAVDVETKVEVTGPLTDIASALPCSEEERDETARALQGRPVWLAADLTDAEIDAVETAHREACRFAHRLLLVILPREKTAGQVMNEIFDQRGWRVGCSSVVTLPRETDQVFIADNGEEHGLWFRLAPVTFVSGTLNQDIEASDPYAPATLGSAVVHGPSTDPESARFGKLSAANASLKISRAEELGDAVQRLLAPDKAAVLAEAGWRVTTEGAHVVERLSEHLETAFDRADT